MKILRITADTTTSNDAFVKIFIETSVGKLINRGRFLHIRCDAHVLNLLVQDGLKVIEKSVYRIRDMPFSQFKSQSAQKRPLKEVDYTPIWKRMQLQRWKTVILMSEVSGRKMKTYPTLSRMTQDILAIPVSIVAFETTLSTTERFIDQYCTCLDSSTVEASTCTQSWLHNE